MPAAHELYAFKKISILGNRLTYSQPFSMFIYEGDAPPAGQKYTVVNSVGEVMHRRLAVRAS
jgi:hypothetical protein